MLRAWLLVSRQLRVGVSGLVGVDMGASRAVLSLYGLWTVSVHRGLMICERELLRYAEEARELDRSQTLAKSGRREVKF